MTSKTETLIGLSSIALFIGVFLYYFIKSCKKVTDTPESCNPMNEEEPFKEPITYIFKTDKGIIVKNAHKAPHQFTIDKAKHYAKCFSDYEIQKYGDVVWHSCSTYFKEYDGQYPR